MSKTIKKLLSIILAVLMIVATVPFAFAADTAVPDTVYFDNTSSAWSMVNAYFFDDSNQSVYNNGTQMAEVGDNIYSIEVPEGALYVVFNDNTNRQTADLTIPTDGANCYDYGSNGWTTFSFAAESDGIKTTLDISKGKIVITGDSVTVDSENVETDPDGYIITGSSYGVDTALQINNDSGSKIILDMIFKDMTIVSKQYSTAFRVDGSSPIVLNILFEGTNVISADNHPAIFGSGAHVVNITYSDDSVPQFINRNGGDNVCSSSVVVNINGKQVGSDGHPHENTDGVQTCSGYKCNICNSYFGKKDENAHYSEEEQTCKGYLCNI